MSKKEWIDIWQERITNLLSRRFLGFNACLVLGYFKPDLFAMSLTLYGILVGGKIAQEFVRGKVA